MRPVLASAVVALAALACAPAWAQSAPTASQAGLRQLGWPGKAEPRAAAPVSHAAPPRARPAQPNRYSARTGTAQPVWNPFPEIAPAAANLRPVQTAPAYPAAPQPWRPPVVQQPAPVLRAAPQPVTPQSFTPPPAAAPMRPAGPAVAAASPAGSRLRQPPGAPMSVARPDRELAAPPQRPAAQPAAPARPAAQPTRQVAGPPFAPAPLMPAPAAPAPQAAVVDPAPPRSYADFSRPMGSPPAATAAPAAPVADAIDAPPRSYADFSHPMSAQPAAPAPGQPVSATGGEGPRYYSLHREYGRQPDHPEIPEAIYLDSLGSEDLAAPPPPIPSDRDERRARAAAADPDAPSGN